jgi:hypothetical protein
MALSRLKRPLLIAAALAVPLLAAAQDSTADPSTGAWGAGWDQGSNAGHLFAIRGIPLLFVVLITIVALAFLNQRERRRQELLARFIDRGQEIPAALLPQPRYSRNLSLRRGIGLTCLGLGLGLAIYLNTGDLRSAAWCLVPLSLGIGSFINAMLGGPGPGASG